MAREQKINNMPLGYWRDRKPKNVKPLRQQPGYGDVDVLMVGAVDDKYAENWERIFPGSTSKFNIKTSNA